MIAAATVMVVPSFAHAQDGVSAASDSDAQPWYEAYTFSSDQAPGVDLEPDNEVQFDLGDGWGFTFAYDEQDNPLFSDDEFASGVFVDLGERFSFSGSVRFATPDSLIVGTQTEERAPEVKFETAIRF